MNAQGLLVNVDVDDLERGKRFYCEGLGLRVGRQFDGWVELVGRDAPIYLLPKAAGTQAFREDGRLALLADPFGNGFCLLEFTGGGYDEITVR
jgi:catechol 2,3-dioxygenase-like lactoylglutathione lyase family enzyme